MGIVNRSLDVSEQQKEHVVSFQAVVTGSTLAVFCAPYPCEVEKIELVGIGLSGAPNISAAKQVFVAGAGATVYGGVGASLVLTALGVSGAIGMSVAATGSTLAQLNTGDVLILNTAAANTACGQLHVTAVIKRLQDIVSYY